MVGCWFVEAVGRCLMGLNQQWLIHTAGLMLMVKRNDCINSSTREGILNCSGLVNVIHLFQH